MLQVQEENALVLSGGITLYKVVRIERFINTVFRDDFKFKSREEAEEFFAKEEIKPEVVDLALYYCFPYGDDKELTRFTKEKRIVND